MIEFKNINWKVYRGSCWCRDVCPALFLSGIHSASLTMSCGCPSAIHWVLFSLHRVGCGHTVHRAQLVFHIALAELISSWWGKGRTSEQSVWLLFLCQGWLCTWVDLDEAFPSAWRWTRQTGASAGGCWLTHCSLQRVCAQRPPSLADCPECPCGSTHTWRTLATDAGFAFHLSSSPPLFWNFSISQLLSCVCRQSRGKTSLGNISGSNHSTLS